MYRANHVRQKDGSSLQWANCRMAVAATHLDFHTHGIKRCSGALMRSHQDDQSGGTDADDARRAWERGHDEVLVIRNGKYWAKLLDDRASGRFIAVDVWYEEIGNRCQERAAFGHTIGIAPEDDDRGWWLVSDPLCPDWRYMDPEDIRRGAWQWSYRILGGASRRTLGMPHKAVGATESPDTASSGTMSQPDDTGGVGDEISGPPIFYTTSIGDTEMSGLLFRPTVGVTGTFRYDVDANSIRTSDRQFLPVKKGASRPVQARVQITDPEMFPGQTAYLAAQGDESVIMLASRGTFTPTAPDHDDVIAQRDAEWVEHLTPPTP